MKSILLSSLVTPVTAAALLCSWPNLAPAENGNPPAIALDHSRDAAARESPALNSKSEKLSYALGLNTGKSYRLHGVEVDLDLFRQGLKDGIADSKSLLTEEELAFLSNEFQTEMKQRAAALQKARQSEKALADKLRAEKTKADGEAFLAENKTKEGVVTLESGLQYKVLKTGEGNKPGPADAVVCHYRGTLIDGTEFDNSYERDKPATLPLKNVIKGWAEALPLMGVGSKWQLFVPSHLAYGSRPAGKRKVIEPNSTLVFEIELLDIKDRSAGRERAANAGVDDSMNVAQADQEE